MQLRSGTLEAAPKKKIASAYRIFYDERKHHHAGLVVAQLSIVISDEFEKLSEKERDIYEEQYEKYNEGYKKTLLAFYGASKTDIKKIQAADIPEKPKRPQAPVKRYQYEVIEQFQKENPETDSNIIHKMIADTYRGLSATQKLIYEKPYETEYESYQTEKDEWNEKYGDKNEAHQKFVDEKYKRVKDKDDDEFVYQELFKVKKTMKMKDVVQQDVKHVTADVKHVAADIKHVAADDKKVTAEVKSRAKVGATSVENKPQGKMGRPKSKEMVNSPSKKKGMKAVVQTKGQ